MRTIQMTFDEELVKTVDEVVQEMSTTRSAFAREALLNAVNKYRETRLEQQHRAGYKKHPSTRQEFGVWEDEQNWGDE